ncbi:MAG TPA: VCBS repeat-containing protein [Spirochaetota bacterium]|nr:VCBS repeat-containing protein [Spirochaetota bacterium]
MKILLFFILVITVFQLFPDEWNVSVSEDYLRITDSKIKDLDNDNIDEIVVSYFTSKGKFIDIYKSIKGELVLIDKIKVPQNTIFFDAGDLDNDNKADILFLTSYGIYFREIENLFTKDNNDELTKEKYQNLIKENKNTNNSNFKIYENIYSEIVVSQPELLKTVNMIIDLNGDGKNELIIENIRSIEVYETKTFSIVDKIKLETILEFSMVPGQFYPQYIFYTLPIILVSDLDGDNKKEIITKFPKSINIYGRGSSGKYELKRVIKMGEDNVYFLSNSFVKFSFPVITDIDNDNIKEIVVSSANLDMPKIKFEAIGDVYYFDKNKFVINKNKQIVLKGIPINLPYFLNISDDKYKDFICPVIPFNLISIFGLLSGNGSVNVPFIYYTQDKEKFDMNRGKKLFEIPFRIENISSFVEELPFDSFKKGELPDFYYFQHNYKQKIADITHYFYDDKKKSYQNITITTLSLKNYTPELPSTLKLGNFSLHIKKDVLFITHKNLYLISRK